MRSDRFTPPAARGSSVSGPPGSAPGAGWLARLVGGLVALVMVAAAIIFSAVVLAVVAVVAAAALGWFWWKTRAVRRQLREAAAGPRSTGPLGPGQRSPGQRSPGQRESVSDARIIREIDPGQ